MLRIKEGFKGERTLSMPEEQLDAYSNHPLGGNLYLRKIGFFPKVKYHFVLKQNGCDYCMLIYCIGGKGWYHIGGKKYSVTKDHFLLIPSGIPYAFGADNDDPWTIYFMHFRGKSASCFAPTPSAPRSLLPNEHSRMQYRLQLFEEIYDSFSMAYIKDYMIYTSMCLYQFLASFVYQTPYCHLSSKPSRTDSLLSARVIRYMQENLQHDLTLDQLATYFKYSPSHFSMLFQRETGTSPINYFIRLKVQRACQYLELTRLKINDIAFKLGFSEAAYFSRTFTKIRGVSPSEYRRRETERHSLAMTEEP